MKNNKNNILRPFLWLIIVSFGVSAILFPAWFVFMSLSKRIFPDLQNSNVLGFFIANFFVCISMCQFRKTDFYKKIAAKISSHS